MVSPNCRRGLICANDNLPAACSDNEVVNLYYQGSTARFR